MKNRTEDVNNHLIAQLERLGDESMPIDERKLELNVAKSMSVLVSAIINNNRVALDVAKFEQKNPENTLPTYLKDKKSIL